MAEVVLSLGSNCGNRRDSVEKALKWLESVLEVKKASSVYETPCARREGPNYMNGVVKGFFSGSSEELDSLLKNYERIRGRNEECRKRGDVPLDIDIVIADGTILKEWDFSQKFFQIGFREINS